MDDDGRNGGALIARRRVVLAAAIMGATTLAARAEWLRDEVVVYADPALRGLVGALGARFVQAQRVRCFCAAPLQMVALLAHGTQDDVLITQSAAMNSAAQAGVVSGPRGPLWRNRLVFAARGAGPAARDFDVAALRDAVGSGRLALPDPSDASAIDGPALLHRLGAGDTVAGLVLGAADSEDAVATLQRGEAAVALCHASEVAGDPALRVLMRIPDNAYEPIIYEAALSHAAWSRYDAPFMAFLRSGASADAVQYGLELLTGAHP